MLGTDLIVKREYYSNMATPLMKDEHIFQENFSKYLEDDLAEVDDFAKGQVMKRPRLVLRVDEDKASYLLSAMFKQLIVQTYSSFTPPFKY